MELGWGKVDTVRAIHAITEEAETCTTPGWVKGVFVVHRPTFLYKWERGYHRYYITHIPSGTAMPISFPDRYSAKLAVAAYYRVLPMDDPRWQLTFEQIVNQQDAWEVIRDLLTPQTQALYQWLEKYEATLPPLKAVQGQGGKTYKVREVRKEHHP